MTTPALAPLDGAAPYVGEGRALVAARVGTTRLIDNVPLALGPSGDHPTGEESRCSAP
ncbi:hypothetical protein [Nocardioides sp. YIM 152588]|uniref:hypothetical protein n=1 Tax=Nocardioides sp. YIM 152588 TaxID=3158259 RepID=UPI0032E50936